MLSLLLAVARFLIGVALPGPGTGRGIGLRNRSLTGCQGIAPCRSLTQLGGGVEAALAEVEDALVPAFIIEELETGRFMVSYHRFRRR